MKSRARAALSQLIEDYGINGSLLVPNSLVRYNESDRDENAAPGAMTLPVHRCPEHRSGASSSPLDTCLSFRSPTDSGESTDSTDRTDSAARRSPAPAAVDPPPPTAPFYEAFAFPHAPGLWPEYGVVCVSGEVGEEGGEGGEGDAEQCGEGLPSATRAGWVDEWMRRHSYETGHARFRRTVIDYATLEPPVEFAVRVVPGGRPKSPPNAAGAVRDDDRNRR
ncbi:hypothetical protein AB0I49_33770 [Streptomyces sp. NPDC050617]|uniref:hypothetical protein n=1 Tax=Streptomyces sp. NPDC050617 TaxID=3154628 RepID=UPI00341DE479